MIHFTSGNLLDAKTEAIINTELMVKTKVVQEELETRKLVERAKEVLMRHRSPSYGSGGARAGVRARYVMNWGPYDV